ncbi:MAG: hypothetical protein ABW006_09670 [Hyphomicrobium sp.]
MIGNFEVLTYVTAFGLLSLAVYALLTGSKPPENSWLGKYYIAEPRLGPVGNVMLAVLSAGTLIKLAVRLGYFSPTDPDTLAIVVGTPFFVFVAVYFFFWFRALRKVRGTRKEQPRQ